MVDIEEDKLKGSLENGATDIINSKVEDVVEKAHELTDGYGPTVVIDAACFHGSFLTACKCAGNAGRVITMGFGVDGLYDRALGIMYILGIWDMLEKEKAEGRTV